MVRGVMGACVAWVVDLMGAGVTVWVGGWAKSTTVSCLHAWYASARTRRRGRPTPNMHVYYLTYYLIYPPYLPTHASTYPTLPYLPGDTDDGLGQAVAGGEGAGVQVVGVEDAVEVVHRRLLACWGVLGRRGV